MYLCRICQFFTGSPYEYMRHYRIHSNAPNFQVTLLQHYKTLTDVDIEPLLSSSVDAKMSFVYKYCCNSRANSIRKVLQEMQLAMGTSGESQVVRNGLLLLVAALLDEDISEMIIFKVSAANLYTFLAEIGKILRPKYLKYQIHRHNRLTAFGPALPLSAPYSEICLLA